MIRIINFEDPSGYQVEKLSIIMPRWFVWDASLVVTAMGLICMCGCAISCIWNVSTWLGASAAGILTELALCGMSTVTLYAHWITMTTNPGVIPKDIQTMPLKSVEDGYQGRDPMDFDFIYCDICDANRPKR